MKVNAKTDVAITILMAPPGTLAGRFNGATTKESLIEAVKKIIDSGNKPCCPPGGACGPTKQPAAKGKPAKGK